MKERERENNVQFLAQVCANNHKKKKKAQEKQHEEHHHQQQSKFVVFNGRIISIKPYIKTVNFSPYILWC